MALQIAENPLHLRLRSMAFQAAANPLHLNIHHWLQAQSSQCGLRQLCHRSSADPGFRVITVALQARQLLHQLSCDPGFRVITGAAAGTQRRCDQDQQRPEPPYWVPTAFAACLACLAAFFCRFLSDLDLGPPSPSPEESSE